jgi:broad specificity phosphatase PhoE
MKEVYLLRHGEKDADGLLTEQGIRAAEAMRSLLPPFAHIFSSDSPRTIHTATLLTGEEPQPDLRAAYATTAASVSAEISAIASERAISFLDAARLHNNPAVLEGIDEKAHGLNVMIDEVLGMLSDGERALIVSHDLTIAPAMGFRGMSAESIEPLGGYVIGSDGMESSVQRYSASVA